MTGGALSRSSTLLVTLAVLVGMRGWYARRRAATKRIVWRAGLIKRDPRLVERQERRGLGIIDNRYELDVQTLTERTIMDERFWLDELVASEEIEDMNHQEQTQEDLASESKW